MMILLLCASLAVVAAGPATDGYKDQFCTDPRTMKKHAAYTEWADAYSCTRHRCQPGGRNLAIYTVGCKRVEAPESAIECEEVVEDTNMQFPYCCTRLRCLVVVRGEVWTRVLGQPWESLPAAPWSHMYKMKKPPPSSGLLPKNPSEGPVYELAVDEKVLRSSSAKKALRTEPVEQADCDEVKPRTAQSSASQPDIVIALSTTNDRDHDREHDRDHEVKTHKKTETVRHKRGRKTTPQQSSSQITDDERQEKYGETEEPIPVTEKLSEAGTSEERFNPNNNAAQQKSALRMNKEQVVKNPHQLSWTEIPQNQWNEHDPSMDSEPTKAEHIPTPEFLDDKKPKTSNLQELVDAIGNRMRDIESVVQKMNDRVDNTADRTQQDNEKHKPAKESDDSDHGSDGYMRAMKPSTESDNYKRYSLRNRSKYLHSGIESTSEQPSLIEENPNGYFSDPSNNLIRRANPPKEPAATYMAPIENRRKGTHNSLSSGASEEVDKRKKKHMHKKKHGLKNGKSHKKRHGKDEKRKRFNKINSVEVDKNVLSLEDTSNAVKK